MMRRMWRGAAAAAMVAGLAAACGGGGSSTPTSPTPPPSGGGGGGNSQTATITITATGASPRQVTIAPGGRVTFINQDSRSHDMTSDPHPEHTDCPELNQVGFLQPGQQRTTGNLNTPRTCGFHDHNLPGNTSLQGTITIR